MKRPKSNATFFQPDGALKGLSRPASLGLVLALTYANRLIPLAQTYPMADAARMAVGVPKDMSARLKRAITIIAKTGVPFALILLNTCGRLPSIAMECIALADPRKAVWMIKIIAATSMIMDMYAPIGPIAACASGNMGEIGCARIPSMPNVPVTAAWTRMKVNRQTKPQLNRAFGTSECGFLYSGP